MCQHLNFESQVIITRLKEKESDTAISGYSAALQIKCRDCDMKFEFIGLEAGLSPYHPMVNVDSTEMRIPIKPATGQLIFEQTHRLN